MTSSVAEPVRMQNASDPSDAAPSWRLRRRARLPWISLLLLSLGAVVVLVHLAQRTASPPQAEHDREPVPETAFVAPPPQWRLLADAVPFLAVDDADLDGLPFAHEARRHYAGGGREDTVVFGRFPAPEPHLRVTAYRIGDEIPGGGSFFIDLARRAAEVELAVTRVSRSSVVATKFGPAEVAEVVLAGQIERTCLAFRSDHPQVGLRLFGWSCGADGHAPGAEALVCRIDRVFVTPGEGAAWAAFLVESERRRGACAAVPSLPRAAPPQAGDRRVDGARG